MLNAELQYTKSRCRSATIERGARSRVRTCLQQVRQLHLPCDDILVIGPQHGFEPDELRIGGISNIMVLDIAPEFIDDCRQLGFSATLSPMEELTAAIPGTWNIYSSHSLEHAADRTAAITEMHKACRDWLFVVLPLEPSPSKDPAHLSQFHNWKEVDDAFSHQLWNMLYGTIQHSRTTDQSEVQLLLAPNPQQGPRTPVTIP